MPMAFFKISLSCGGVQKFDLEPLEHEGNIWARIMWPGYYPVEVVTSLFLKTEQRKDLQEGIQSDIQTQQTTDTEELNNTFSTAVDKFGVSVSDFKKMSVGMSFGTGKSILTVEGIRNLIGSKKDDGLSLIHI